MKRLKSGFAFFPLFFGLLVTTSSGQTSKQSFSGMRLLPDYEADVYGPLVFPEEVHNFLDHEIDYLLKRQNADGSWDSAQPQGNGRTTMQAGGTVDKVTLTSMCGYSLRKHPEHDPKRIDDAVTQALKFVLMVVPAGRLKTEVQDAPWRYIYSLRFLIHEYPHVSDSKVKKEVESTCAYILEKLKHMQFVTKRSKPSVWTARRESGVGGWGYLKSVKGSNTFVTADALRELLKARVLMPGLEIDEGMLYPCFRLISSQRRIQPNSKVESYSYDSAGSFQRIRDIRGDVGRLCSAELACLVYSDTFKVKPNEHRNQKHLEKALKEWLKYRGILDKVKFPSGHADFSIAPWFWMYSYRTTLEAADYLTINEELKEEVRRTSLNAFFKHMKFYFEPKLGASGWIIGGDLSKELHDSCQMLDGLATLKHLYQPRLKSSSPELIEVREHFAASEYGEVFTLLQKQKVTGETKLLSEAIQSRFNNRLNEIKSIHQKYPLDGLRYLEGMKENFSGYPKLLELEKLEKQWRKDRPDLPSVEMLEWVALGPYPGPLPDGERDAKAWGKILKGKTSENDLLAEVDPTQASIKGIFKTASKQVLTPSTPYARMQLNERPEGSYKLETQFTRIKGDCIAVMFPVANASALLVVSGWGGKVSGLAFINGKDADRNATTRDGKLKNGVSHTLTLTVQLLDEKKASIEVTLNSKPYIQWSGPISSLRPDRYWRLRDSKAIGIGGYNSRIVFHQLQVSDLKE